jgi:methylamine---corrinoid protein Co-methyltransferase
MERNFCETIWRAMKGKKMEEREFDMALFKKVEKLRKESDLKYTPGIPVNLDDRLADELFAMGMELYAEVGTYCTNTNRVIQYTQEEIRGALQGPGKKIILGEGPDAVEVKHLSIEGGELPVVCGGVQTLIYRDEKSMFAILKACAADRCIDGLWGGVTDTVEGTYEVIAGTPLEVYAFGKQIEVLRDAVTAAGRPGMFILNNAPLSTATIAMRDERRGLRKSDPCETTAVSELKITYDDLNRSAYAKTAGVPLCGYHGAMIGGFSGSVEGAAIVAVAGALQLLMVNHADIINPGVNHIRVKSKSTRDQIWVASIAHQACGRQMDVPIEATIGDPPAAGPGTKQYFYEGAAGLIASTVCGCHAFGGTRKFVVGKRPNYGTPLESRWYGEVLKGAAGLTRGKANEIILTLLEKYEDHLADAPAGDVFEGLYDVAKGVPRPEYQRLYDESKEDLARLGLPFKRF